MLAHCAHVRQTRCLDRRDRHVCGDKVHVCGDKVHVGSDKVREPCHVTAHKRQRRQAMWEKQKEHDEELLKSDLARQDKSKCGWGGLAARPCALALPQCVPQSMGEDQKVVCEWVDTSSVKPRDRVEFRAGTHFVALEWRQPLD